MPFSPFHRRLLVAAFVSLSNSVIPTAASAGDVDDTVLLKNGGRVRGTVMSEDPGQGVSVKLADGSVRAIPTAEVERVEYGTQAAEAPPGTAPPAAPGPLPPPAPVGGAAPLATNPATPAPPQHDTGSGFSGTPAKKDPGFSIGFGAAIGMVAANEDPGPWGGLRLSFDVPLNQTWYVRLEGELAGHAGRKEPANPCDVIYSREECEQSEIRDYAEGSSTYTMQLLIARALGGYRFSEAFSVRAGPYVGFGNGNVDREGCGNGSASGPAFGAAAAPALALGAQRQLELGLQLDLGITPSPQCHRRDLEEDPPTTTTSSPSFDTEDEVGWGALAFVSYFWR
jgi:hypothetical protein